MINNSILAAIFIVVFFYFTNRLSSTYWLKPSYARYKYNITITYINGQVQIVDPLYSFLKIDIKKKLGVEKDCFVLNNNIGIYFYPILAIRPGMSVNIGRKKNLYFQNSKIKNIEVKIEKISQFGIHIGEKWI